MSTPVASVVSSSSSSSSSSSPTAEPAWDAAVRRRPRPDSPSRARIFAGDLTSAAGRGAIAVDIRDASARRRHGALPGAVVIDPEVIVDRLFPSGVGAIALAVDADVEWVLVSTDGFDAAFVAARLRRLGLWRATAVAGGFHAIAAARMLTAFADAVQYRVGVEAFAAHV